MKLADSFINLNFFCDSLTIPTFRIKDTQLLLSILCSTLWSGNIFIKIESCKVYGMKKKVFQSVFFGATTIMMS